MRESGGGTPLWLESWKLRDEGSGILESSKVLLGADSDFKVGADIAASENIIPLSPQWLFSKPTESKPPIATMEPPQTPGTPSHGGLTSEALIKERWRGDGVARGDGGRDVGRDGGRDGGRDWRSISLERNADNSRRDRWREEERENSTAARRDRWKEGERETAETCRGERWAENNAGRDATELRRLPSDRWTDTANRETSFEARRDSKWSTC
ncbi:hypothetical protein MPTK1_2g10250 [Marchantia polymorpha subsp. ruderalis]|uniref:Uncharacterized protein n=1 Tax=Marchantia polymorpha TaxID=3197 RepID=A0A2R6W8J3_MARPO|nr:hypothetical protein MARPO_0129s0048 [Marchantia polymorpha]BBN01785.1 hypothetical protein Mp_2g10250 [Marchantia polymorpha subsp. ruderalis]|eukprot:PTQ30167.1 hypothetical protein MARPO_0129s0048 [Marchantia polymorpha]